MWNLLHVCLSWGEGSLICGFLSGFFFFLNRFYNLLQLLWFSHLMLFLLISKCNINHSCVVFFFKFNIMSLIFNLIINDQRYVSNANAKDDGIYCLVREHWLHATYSTIFYGIHWVPFIQHREWFRQSVATGVSLYFTLVEHWIALVLVSAQAHTIIIGWSFLI